MKNNSQVKNNPYPYSSDNKRYQTYSYYLKTNYHQKLAKIPLNSNFTCPNRDGSKSYFGCYFCSSKGSGDSVDKFHADLKTQFESGLARARKKWPSCKGIAYFQSYSNTYADINTLKNIYNPFFEDEDVEQIAIATRADCLEDDFLDYLSSKMDKKEVWVELGLQSIHESTMNSLNRQHSTQEVESALKKLQQRNIQTCIHIINGLPGETKEMMIETAKWVAKQHPTAVKIHMLHLIKNTVLHKRYELKPFHLLSKEEYVDIVCDQLEVLPKNMIIERLTGDGLAEDLIAPLWTIKKTSVINDIDTELFKRNSYQSKYYRK